MSSNATSGKSKIVIILITVAVLIAVIAATAVFASKGLMTNVTMAETVKLEKKNISNSVSVSGVVESRNSVQVSAKLQYPIETVNAEVGDKVKKGDILAVLSSDDLENQILQQQATVSSSNINSEYSLSDAEKRYNEALEQINTETYPEIRNAKMSLDSAATAFEKAKENYAEQLEIQGTDSDTQLVAAEKSVESAKYDLDCAYTDYEEAKKEVKNEDYSDISDLKKTYENAKKEYDSRFSDEKSTELKNAHSSYEAALLIYTNLSNISRHSPESIDPAQVTQAQENLAKAEEKFAELEAKYDVESTEDTYKNALEKYTQAKADIDYSNKIKLQNAERSYERAKAAYDNAVNNLNSVKNGNSISLENYKDAVDEAQSAYNDSLESYELAVKNADSTLASLKAAADRERVLSENDTQVIALEILKEQLDDCVIKAPCDGTVTVVNAVEGSSPAGTLFIIEDTDNLKMTASVKEYNVTELKEGLDVTVTIPSLDNKEFSGKISSIAPTSAKGADGKSDGSASFAIEVDINDTKDAGVLIGMTSKCTAVTSSTENVFAVSYDSLVEDADGNAYIFAADMKDDGTAAARKIDVEIGFESDAELEIISDELSEGMEILTNASDLTDGCTVVLTNGLLEDMPVSE